MLDYKRLLTLASVEFHPKKLDQIEMENRDRVDHWIFHLSEVGEPLIKRAREILGLHSQIETLYDEIVRLEKQIDHLEKEAEQSASTDWTKKEIKQAIKDAKVHIDLRVKEQALKKKLSPALAKRLGKIRTRKDGKPKNRDEFVLKDQVQEFDTGSRAIYSSNETD
jgi:hypothetical protein